MARPLDSIDKCTTCSTCVASCPVTRATRRFRGPKLTGPSSERFRRLNKEEIEALDYCSNCKNCDMSCPFGVEISTLNMLARGEQARHRKPPLRDWVLAHGHTLAKLTAWTRILPPALMQFGMTNPLTRKILDYFGVDQRAPMPVFAPERFDRLFANRGTRKKTGKTIVFFPGCYINDYDPQTGLDVVWWMEQAGYDVVVPENNCCGVPLVANGFLDEARARAATLTATLAVWTEKGAQIVTACPSCALMLKQEYAELFPEIPYLDAVRPHVRDACEVLTECVEQGELSLPTAPADSTLVYHEPCHLRAQGIGKPGFNLLRAAGATIQDAGGECCGIAGSYGFKKGKYEVASRVGAPIFAVVKQSGADVAVSECGTCRLQLAHHTGLPVAHPLSVLRRMQR